MVKRILKVLGVSMSIASMVIVASCVEHSKFGSKERTEASLYSSVEEFIADDEGVIASNRCKKDLITTRDNVLVAERIVPDDTHYIEFRYRLSPVLPSGHMYVVYGQLDENGLPVSFNYTGLFPKGSVVGLYTGILLPVGLSANVDPSVLDCNFLPIAAYRRSISAAQYDNLLMKVAEYRASPPRWSMLSFNCNHYAASLGETVGLKSPQGRRSQQFLSDIYFRQYVKANGDKIRWKHKQSR